MSQCLCLWADVS